MIRTQVRVTHAVQVENYTFDQLRLLTQNNQGWNQGRSSTLEHRPSTHRNTLLLISPPRCAASGATRAPTHLARRRRESEVVSAGARRTHFTPRSLLIARPPQQSTAPARPQQQRRSLRALTALCHTTRAPSSDPQTCTPPLSQFVRAKYALSVCRVTDPRPAHLHAYYVLKY